LTLARQRISDGGDRLKSVAVFKPGWIGRGVLHRVLDVPVPQNQATNAS